MKRTLVVGSVAAIVGALLTVAPSPVAAAPVAGVETATSAVAKAGRIIRANPGVVRAASGETHAVRGVKVDTNGAAHVRYARTYKGLRVYAGEFIVHTRADGSLASASVGLNAPLSLSTTPKVDAATAGNAARVHFTGSVTGVDASELLVDASSGVGRLAYETVVRGVAPDGQTPSALHVFTDATSGAVLGSYDEVQHINGTGNTIYAGAVTVDTTLNGAIYSMIDPSHGNGYTCDMFNMTVGPCVIFTDADNVWGNFLQSNRQSAGADAHYGAALTYDYFKFVHGRNGIFGNGAGVPSRVHFGNNYVNAFWDGSQMTYGDGALNQKPLVSIDVAGHEMSHGITQAVAGLIYAGESGGLNEATSDIFGNMVEFYANNPNDPGDYLVGEKIDIFGNGQPLRFMYDPPLDGNSHGCWSTTTQFVDVHYSSGVGNHFFFNLAEGTGVTPYGTSPVCGSAPAVTGIGRAKAEAIWWRALDLYMTPTTRYVLPANPANTSRAYTLTAAADLYGLCSLEYQTVQAAWTAVNVAGNDAICPPNDFSLTISPTSGKVQVGGTIGATVSTAVVSGVAETVTFSASGLPAGSTVTFNPPSVTAGGSSIMRITTTNATPLGTYTVTVTGTAPSTSHSTPYTLVVVNCIGSNDTNVPIPDVGSASSPITITGCPGNASATSVVGVAIIHPRITDVDVYLVAPDGSTYLLFQGILSPVMANLHRRFTVNLSSEVANGTWKLLVRDTVAGASGFIDGWSLVVGP